MQLLPCNLISLCAVNCQIAQTVTGPLKTIVHAKLLYIQDDYTIIVLRVFILFIQNRFVSCTSNYIRFSLLRVIIIINN